MHRVVDEEDIVFLEAQRLRRLVGASASAASGLRGNRRRGHFRAHVTIEKRANVESIAG